MGCGDRGERREILYWVEGGRTIVPLALTAFDGFAVAFQNTGEDPPIRIDETNIENCSLTTRESGSGIEGRVRAPAESASVMGSWRDRPFKQEIPLEKRGADSRACSYRLAIHSIGRSSGGSLRRGAGRAGGTGRGRRLWRCGLQPPLLATHLAFPGAADNPKLVVVGAVFRATTGGVSIPRIRRRRSSTWKKPYRIPGGMTLMVAVLSQPQSMGEHGEGSRLRRQTGTRLCRNLCLLPDRATGAGAIRSGKRQNLG